MKEREIEERFFDLIGLCQVGPEISYEHVEIGRTKLHFMEIGIIKFIDWWVSQIENLLSFYDKYSDDYSDIFDTRFFTYEEFRLLFSPMPSGDPRLLKPFEFLCIENEAKRIEFIGSMEYDFKNYLFILKEHPEIPFSEFVFREREVGIQIPISKLQQNAYVPARLGSGKSELLKLMFFDLQRKSAEKRNMSLILVDPHGDLANQAMRFRLNEEKERLIYIDPYLWPDMTPTINPMQINDLSEQSIDVHSAELTKAVIALVDNSSLTLQMDALLKPCLATLLRKGNSDLFELQRFMDDSNNDDLISLGKKSPNKSHRYFFENYFKSKGSSYNPTKSGIFTRLQSILNSSTLSNLLTGKSTIDLEEALNSGKVVIFSLSQGLMGSQYSQVFGKFLLAYIQSIAIKRAEVDEGERMPTFAFVDEFQVYATESIGEILSQTRKYKLNMILANQTPAQLESTRFREVVMSNTGVKLIGENSLKSLKSLAPEIGITADSIQALEKYYFFLKYGDIDPLPVKAPSTLIGMDETFYLDNLETDKLKKWISLDSGYYRKIEKNNPSANTQTDPQDDNLLSPLSNRF